MLRRRMNPPREREPDYDRRVDSEPNSNWTGNFGQARPVPCMPFLTAERTGAGTVGLVDIQSRDGSAQPVAIMLVSPHVLAVTAFAEMVAVVEFGVGGAETIAVVDFLHGQVLNLIASHVRVSAVQQMVRPAVVPAGFISQCAR